MLSHESIAARIGKIQQQIEAACVRSGRSSGDVRLMAVSKTHPAEAIASAYAAGLRLFGENRVQEFQQKLPLLEDLGVRVSGHQESVDGIAEIRFIGHLQSNKAGRAAEIFSGIDTVDSLKLAQRLDEAASRLARRLSILIEIKLSGESTKSGLAPESRELAELLERLPDLAGVEMRGLMTVAPLDENSETARSCFRRLYGLREELAVRYPRLDFNELSTGMSGDFEIAIEEGSTLVRIGTAIFGARPQPA